MSRIFWDTNLFIYLIEGAGDPARLVRKLLSRMIERRDELLTSTLTLGEVLAKPVETGAKELADRYNRLLESPGIQMLPFDRASARIYATLRSDRGLQAPDAMQLACAAAAQANLFITNDSRLSRRVVPGIDFIVPLQQAWF